MIPQELAGSIVSSTAAEAHWQLGKVEVHGGWFARVLEKVIADCAPKDRESWLECVFGAHCKNELIQVYGMTPTQFVFGRNPRVPHNLLDEPLNVLPATAPLYEESIAKAVSVRQAARKAVVELQDDKALRLALASRPRVTRTFVPGTPVAYWRTQKSHEGKIERGGRWYGPAIVLGYVGKNLVVIHKRQIFRCAPEQVRQATTEERSLMDTPNLELLGIKNLLQNNALESRQYVDLVPQPLPPPEPVSPDEPMPEAPAIPVPVPNLPASGDGPPPGPDAPLSAEPAADSQESGFQDRLSGSRAAAPFPVVEPGSIGPQEESSYGPVRRVSHKSPPVPRMLRPRAMLQDDFAEMMQEVIPELLEQALSSEAASSAQEFVPRGTKREASPHSEPAPSKRVSGETASASSHQPVAEAELPGGSPDSNATESLCVQLQNPDVCVEALVLSYVNKRSPKELLASGNPIALQERVDEAKSIEWQTIESRHAVRVVHGREAAKVRTCFPDRIMGSRFVITEKQEEEAPVRIKARWCLLGHRDPDLSEKAKAGDLQSPTLSHVGRSLIFQLISSHQWTLKLGDVRGAFLSSGELPKKYRPLYATLPPGGIPGVPPDSLVEVVGQVYGLNDSPAAWYRTLNQALVDCGFERSRFDPCVYYLRDQGSLVGVYGVHVDDSATGGHGPKYEAAIAKLQSRFEFRKWRVLDGDFCGAHYTQDPVTFKITMSQEKFCGKLKPLHLSRARTQDRAAPLREDEIRCLRAINGSLNWLATQSRPDLSTQVSFSQQSFPEPTVQDALSANNAIRRARQHAALPVEYKPIAPDRLALMCHSDAAYANGRDGATQAGYVISFTDKGMDQEQVCDWTPAYWKSYRLPRVVNSTLGAEAQAMNAASGMLEWFQLMLREILDGHRCLATIWNVESPRLGMLMTDCKSLFDHLQSKSSPTLDDRRTALDIVIIRDSIAKMKTSLRWLPTDRMLADALTKESAEAVDLLRACLREGRYQVSDEDTVLRWRAKERERRSALKCPVPRDSVGV